MAITLDRLAEGIRRANAAGDTETVKALGAEYRRLQANPSQPAGGTPKPVVQEEPAEKNTGILSAANQGISNLAKMIGRGMESAGELTGSEKLSQLGAAGVKNVESAEAESNYARPEGADGFTKNVRELDFGDALKSLAYQTAEGAPSLGVGAIASIGGAIPATLATGAGILMAAGAQREEAIEKKLDPTATYQDLAAAVASGVLELVPGGKAGGYITKFVREGAQEIGQEGLVVGNTAFKGGEYVPSEVVDRLGDAGATGGTISAGLHGAMTGGDKVLDATKGAITLDRSAGDRAFDKYDAAAAEDIRKAADYDTARLANVDDTGGTTSAQGAAKTALNTNRKALRSRIAKLGKLAKQSNNADLMVKIEDVLGSIDSNTGQMKSGIPDSYIDELLSNFEGVQEAAEAQDLAQRIRRIQPLTESMGDLGGLGKYTRRFDLTDQRNSGLAMGLAAGGLGGVAGGVGGLILGVAAGYGINRTARAFDKATNNRSRVKRYVDSVMAAAPERTPIKGDTVSDLISDFKAARLSQAEAERAATKLAKEEARIDASNASAKEKLGLKAEARYAAEVKAQEKADEKQAAKNEADRIAVMKERQRAGEKAAAKLEAEQKAEAKALAAAKEKRGLIADARYAADEKANAKQAERDAADAARGRRGLLEEPTLDQSNVTPKQARSGAGKGATRATPKEVDQTARRANRRLSEAYFEGGQPMPDHPMFTGWQIWNDQTGLNNSEIYEALSELEEDPASGVPFGTADRYREDIQGLAGKRGPAAALQELVRQKYNPDHVPGPINKRPRSGDVSLKLLEATSGRTLSRGKQKASEGDRRYRNLVAQVERSQGTLTADQFELLLGLVDEINSPGMSVDMRRDMVRNVLPTIFENPVQVDLWRSQFAGLVSIGNAEPIAKVAQQSDEDVSPQKEALEARKVEVRKARKKKSKKTADAEARPVVDDKPKTKAERALATLDKSKVKPTEQLAFDFEGPVQTPNKVEEATTVSVEDLQPVSQRKKPRKEGRNSLKEMVDNRIESARVAIEIAENEAGRLARYREDMGNGNVDKVEGLIYDFANDRVTQNMLTEAFAAKYGVPPAVAAQIVQGALAVLEETGDISRFQPKGNSKLKQNDKYVQDDSGVDLQVVEITVTNPVMKEMLTIAKAINQVSRMVPQDNPSRPFTPDNLKDGNFRAFKDYDGDVIDGTFKPALDFLNALRNQRLSFHPKILESITKALGGTASRKVGEIANQLTPDGDKGNMFAVAQIIRQLADGSGTDTRSRQEWSYGANLRVYSKNGMAHTQSGDLMKGLTRMAGKSPIGGKEGLNNLLHSFGNLLGSDKKSPADRRRKVFEKGTIKTLIDFANDPFKERVLSRDGTLTAIGKLEDSAEGFFQMLNVAMEVRDMAEFARARYKGKGKPLTDEQLLSRPDVLADIADNYSTDFIVQLDASNNAYQLLGLVLGSEKLLAATGMRPQEGVDPDETQGADIYMKPTLAAVERIPELSILEPGQLRKVFKNAIGTILYEAEDSSRRASFLKELTKIAGKDVPIVGTINSPGLITVPEGVEAAMSGNEGFTFTTQRYDKTGQPKSQERVRRRVVLDEGGKAYVEEAKGNKDFTRSHRAYADRDSAIAAVYQSDLLGRMSREILKEVNSAYPEIQEYLTFSRVLSTMLKDAGQGHAKIPTPDGMTLEASFKDEFTHDSIDVKLGEGDKARVVPLGFKTEESKLTGRGVAAFMMHQLDAYVLRKTHAEMVAQDRLKTGFNPIHDSFGFAPNDAETGKQVWAEVMQSLGNSDYNIFIDVLIANRIELKDFLAAGGVIPNRKGVQPVPHGQIPTALS